MTIESEMEEKALSVTFSYDRKMFRRALSGWWQSAVPPEPFLKRALIWAVIWFALGIGTMVLVALDLTPWFMGAALAGAGSLVLVVGVLQRTRMARFHDVIGAHWDKAGATEAEFSASGVVFRDAISKQSLGWPAINAIASKKGVTVLRTGFQMIAIPDKDLPVGLTPNAFRARLNAWKEAA